GLGEVVTWPFRRSIALQREELLQLRIQDLEQQLADAGEREKYFRERYERIDDEALFAKGAIAAPVHVESRLATKENLASKVMRVANIAGSATGVDFTRKKDRGLGLPQ